MVKVIEHSSTEATGGTAPASVSTPQTENEVLFEAPDRQASYRVEQATAGRLLAAIVNPATLLYGQVSVAEGENPMAEVLGGIKLDTTAWPLLGKPEAQLVFVEMFDYTCPHCQRTHQSLEAARTQFGDKLAVITLPVPLDGKCNPTVKSTHASHNEACELAKLAIAVWTVDQTKFESFHHYIFDQKPSYAQAVTKAQSLVDKDELDMALQSEVPSEYVAKHIALYQKAGSGTIPKLLFPNTTTVGAVESPEAMIRLIKQNLQG